MTILAATHTMKFLSMVIFSTTIQTRCHTRLELLVTRTTFLACIELVNQADICSMNLLQSSSQPSLRSWGVAEPCGTGVCRTESHQSWGSRGRRSNLMTDLIQSLVAKNICAKLPASKSQRTVRCQDDCQQRDHGLCVQLPFRYISP